MPYIGQSIPRSDAAGKVTGKALYPGDYNMPNQAYMKILFANRPHAIIKSIDTSLAEALPGVIAVLTSKDVPNNEYGLNIPDQPVLCGPGSNKNYADRVRFIGDQVALMVAESEEIAKIACEMIVVDYQDLPLVTDVLKSLEKDATLLHPGIGTNVFKTYTIDKGDVDEAFTKADVIIEGEYQTPAQEHAFLQPEAGISYIDDEGRITVVVGGQWTHEDQEQIAHALQLPVEKIRVIYPAIGGAFGGKEDMSVQIVLALASWKLHLKGINRPVKIIWSREESIVGHAKRHPYNIKTRWGATKEGKVIAAEVQMVADGGAYAYTSTKVLGNATLLCTGPYEIPNVKVDARVVYTNNIPNGAFRGFGGPQALFAAESQMNKLAQKLNLDPVEIRMRNFIKDGSLTSYGTPYTKGVTITEVAEKCALANGWEKTDKGWHRKSAFATEVPGKPHIKRGLGFACGYKNIGFSYGYPEQCQATIELHGKTEIEFAVLHHAGAEVGQGTHTVMIQMAAEALNIDPEKIRLVASDTATSGSSGSASASRMTFMAGNAIRGAAKAALEKWNTEERPAIAFFQYLAPATTLFSPEYGKTVPNITYGYVAEAAEVEVDIETGLVRVINVTCANDVGKAINPALVQGQIEGGIVQATGYVILENFVQENGQTRTKFLSTYLIPTVLDIPDKVESIILEYPDELGPFGARGMGEMPYLPFAPSITAAVEAATGIWFNEFPLTPERVLKGLEKET